MCTSLCRCWLAGLLPGAAAECGSAKHLPAAVVSGLGLAMFIAVALLLNLSEVEVNPTSKRLRSLGHSGPEVMAFAIKVLGWWCLPSLAGRICLGKACPATHPPQRPRGHGVCGQGEAMAACALSLAWSLGMCFKAARLARPCAHVPCSPGQC